MASNVNQGRNGIFPIRNGQIDGWHKITNDMLNNFNAMVNV